MIIHSFESMAAVDGEGIRCAVFFTGCPLRCVYCHNPDTWHGIGTEYTAEELLKKIKRYKPYFGKKGGVTFSGGEPLLHAKEINELGSLLKDENINYALDTSGCVTLNDEVKKAVKNSSMVICDLKMWDDESYIKYTGRNMQKTLQLIKYTNECNIRLWIRTVIIPGINDSKEILDKYISVINSIGGVEKYQLLGFHTMGFYKYDNLGIENPLKGINDMDSEKLAELQKYVDVFV
ncbi:MAG: pyruvate formate-lyase-activating protein [Eubacterium sp.]